MRRCITIRAFSFSLVLLGFLLMVGTSQPACSQTAVPSVKAASPRSGNE